MENIIVKINNIKIANNLPFILIAGPDSLESEAHAFFLAQEIKAICDKLKVPYIFKASYDKANRASIDSFRGLGWESGKFIFQKIRKNLKIPITTDVHSAEEAKNSAEIIDLIQIPAFLSRQTDIIVAAAATGKAINVKKGQFMAPEDAEGIIQKALSQKNRKLLLTERGTVFGYHNLVADMRSLAIMKKFGYPIIFDASHTVQLPGAQGDKSGGRRDLISTLARSAIAVGVAGIFIEVHDQPEKAPVDGANSLPLRELLSLLKVLKKIDQLVKEVV